MKIAVVSSGNIPSEWANSINTTKHANGFHSLGNKVEIFSLKRYQEKKKLKEIRSINSFYNISSSIKVNLFSDHLRYFNNFLPFKYIYHILRIMSFDRLDYFFDVEKKIAQEIEKKNFDFAYCRSLRTPYYLIKRKVPTVIEMHSPNITNFQAKKLLSLTKSNYFLGISTISEKLKDKYVSLGVPKEKVLVQEDAVDLEKFDMVDSDKNTLREKLKLPKNKKIVLYWGSLRSGKGIMSLIEVAKKSNNSKDILFLIVGGPQELKEEYRIFCKKNNISNIKFLGFVSNKLAPVYMKASDILTLLYDLSEKNTIMDLETTSPMKLFEYMASKNPIVATKIPTIEKIIEDNEEVLFSKIANSSDVLEKINSLLKDEKLSKLLVKNAYSKVKKYTYELRCKNIIELLKNEK